MKKKIAVVVLLIVVSGILIFLYKSISLLNTKAEAKENLKTFPSLSLLSLDSTALNLNHVQDQVIIVYYSSACDLCDYEVEQFKKHIDMLHKTTVIMISTDPLYLIREFALRHKVTDQFTFARIEPREVLTTFGTEALPHILIYKNDKLIKEFTGVTQFESIKKIL